ncbi:MAG TPA: nitrilase-related carbon-nitrogen hydrolase [Gemmatimonadaceae bacterium]
MTAPLRIALGEYDTGWHEPAASLARASQVVRTAAGAGARLVVLPEMCTTGFTMDALSQAEPLDGPSVRALGRLAAGAGVHLIAGVAVREESEGAARAVNTALLFGDDGALRAVYRKQRMFAYAGEDDVYEAGRESVVIEAEGVRLALFVCYDLRFPELFRAVAPDVDAIVIIANWPAKRRAHWDTLIRARAIENQCYVVAVNRSGSGGGIDYDGGSAAFDPWGERLAAGAAGAFAVDPARVRAVREEYPFLRDAVRETSARP